MRYLLVILVLFPVAAFAQSHQGMPPNMQQLDMEQMQKAMACMQNIDMSALEGLEEEAKKIEAEVGALCRSGNRDEALDKVMAYGKEMMSKPELKKMRECGKLAAGMLPQMPFDTFEGEGKNTHICDDF